MMSSENYAINHNMVDVISQSFAASVPTFPSAQSILELRSAFKNAARHHVSVLAATGDWGPTGYTLDQQHPSFFKHRITQWPASDPLVTAVGGTQLHLNATGLRTAPDNVWNDTLNPNVTEVPSPAAAGSGLSNLFPRPAYQRRLRAIIGNHRAYPDVSMSAARSGGVLIFLSAPGPPAAWYHIGGTSEASPLFAGVVAIADQAVDHRLGLLNPRLYALGTKSGGIIDITQGGNTVSFKQHGSKHTVPGWNAGTGYDISSGLGTVDAWRLVRALARSSAS
jgi:subtilase family serine protease